jgi:hypothetical protein
MTRDEMIKMAKQAGSLIEIAQEKDLLWLESFANLVASAERKACAKVCESIDMEAFGVLPVRTVMITSHCAEAIRAREKA